MGSSKPVVERVGEPAFARIPGQTVKPHRLANVKVEPYEPEKKRIKKKQMSERERE